MAKFAPVCPIHILDALARDGAMGDYHLPLAHDVLQHPEDYRRVFVESGHHIETVILDNSVIELGSAVDIDIIAKAAKTVKANVIVLPDILLDGAATVKSCREAISPWASILDKELGEGKWKFMVVPQGKTPAEFAWCAEQFYGLEHIGWWGIPRNYNIKGLGSRRDAVDICRMIDPTYNVHLLGFSDNIVDDMLSANHPHVDGIDSAVPIRAASLGYHMSMGLDQHLPPRGQWWDDPNTTYTPLMASNANIVRRWIRRR